MSEYHLPPSQATALRAHGRAIAALKREKPNDRRTLIVDIDGLGSVITTGLKRAIAIHFDCVITRWRLLADQAGDIVVDIWKTDFAGYPASVADTITAAAQPTLAASDHDEDTALTGWTTAIAAGDILAFHVDSAATLTWAELTLALQRA